MANAILEHEACNRESQSEKNHQKHACSCKLSKNYQDLTSVESAMPTTYSLVFSRTEWHDFWRLLIVGDVIAEELQRYAPEQTKPFSLRYAELWNMLSGKLLHVLSQ